MIHRHLIAIITLALAFPSVASAQGANQRQEVLTFVKAYVDAINRADMTAYVDMYAQQRDLIVASDGQVTRGWEAVRDEANQMMGTEGFYRISAGVVDVVILSPDLAIAVFPFAANVTTQEGPVQFRGAMTLVLRKTAEGWRIIHEHSSTATP
ncbi:MAG TPA: nuclear transport factor 2 family protein [Gammaproteobacteria bacterium]|nr:nuclear transport factor 2 family protein [Gammaproteobacteria bacterium]